MINSIPPLTTSLFVFNLVFLLLITRNRESYFMLPLCIATIWWHFSWVFIFQVADYDRAYIIAKFGHVGILYIPVGFIWLFYRYYSRPKLFLIWGHIFYVICLLLLFLTDWIVRGVKLHSYGYYPLAGKFHFLLLFFIMLTVNFGVGVSLKYRYKSTDSLERTHVNIVVGAVLVFCLAAIDFIPNYDLAEFYPFGFIFSTFFLLIIFYAIFRFSLFSKDRQILAMQAAMLSREKLAMIGTLSAGVAHQLGNTLNNMSISVIMLEQKLKKKTLTDDLIIEIAKSMRQYIDISVSIIRGLDFAAKSNIDRSNLSLREVIDSSIILMKGEFFEQAVVQNNVSEGIKVHAAKNSILQVFMNLISNSLDAIGSNSRAHIIVDAIEDEKNVIISFSDNGPGIPKDIVSRIFEPFFTTKTAENGSGMGLYVVKEEILSNHGFIEIDTTNEKGTRFVITLPKGGVV